jgi:hypothetical protein
MRSTPAIAAAAIGLALMFVLPNSAAAAGFDHRYHADGYGRAYAGPPPPPHRYFRCHGGRYYTFQGGWGCDYDYSSYYLPRRR